MRSRAHPPARTLRHIARARMRAQLEKRQLSGESVRELKLRERLFFHTPVDDARCVLVVQAVIQTVRPGLEVDEHALGWAIVPAFGPEAKAAAAAPDARETFFERSLYAGSAAALLLLDGVHPYPETSTRALSRLGGSTLAYAMHSHMPLLAHGGCAHLMAANALHTPALPLPGLLAPTRPSTPATVASYDAPRLASTFALAARVQHVALPAGAVEAAVATAAAGGARASVSSLVLVARLHNAHVPIGERELVSLVEQPDGAGLSRLVPQDGRGAVTLNGAFLSPRLAVAFELLVNARVGEAVVTLAIADAVLIPFTGRALLCDGDLLVPLRSGPAASAESGRLLAEPPDGQARAAGGARARGAAGKVGAVFELACALSPTDPTELATRLPSILAAESQAEPAIARALSLIHI